jgi:hypothetical protein
MMIQQECGGKVAGTASLLAGRLRCEMTRMTPRQQGPRPTFDMSASRKREQPSLEMIPEKGLHQWLTKRCEHGPGKPVIAQSIWQTNSA